MNSIISTQNSETIQRSPTEETVVEGEDIISKLHQSILGQILSFLPTIEAVHTSVLSTRWIHVWKSITGIQFNDALHCFGKKMPKEQFVCSVNRVLLHFANSIVKSFSLCLTSYHYDSSLLQLSSTIGASNEMYS